MLRLTLWHYFLKLTFFVISQTKYSSITFLLFSRQRNPLSTVREMNICLPSVTLFLKIDPFLLFKTLWHYFLKLTCYFVWNTPRLRFFSRQRNPLSTVDVREKNIYVRLTLWHYCLKIDFFCCSFENLRGAKFTPRF